MIGLFGLSEYLAVYDRFPKSLKRMRLTIVPITSPKNRPANPAKAKLSILTRMLAIIWRGNLFFQIATTAPASAPLLAAIARK